MTGDNVFCPGQKRVSAAYKDGWMRLYQGYPAMNDDIKKMLHNFTKSGKHTKTMVFFTGHCGFDTEYAAFLTRELIRGNL